MASQVCAVTIPSGSRLIHQFFRGGNLRILGFKDGYHSSQLDCSWVTSYYLDGLGNVLFITHYSGMFPCFLGGVAARLVFSAARALITEIRVAAGSMMPSSSPRSAAR